MPHRIHLGQPPAGVAGASGQGEGTIPVIFREFTSTEDGETFVSRLEGTPTRILQLLDGKSPVRASTLDHMVALIQRDGTADVYINELTVFGSVRLRKSVEKGDPLLESDFVDIEELRFDGIDFPAEMGVLVLFSQGWRKGLFFDFGPLLPTPVPRDYDLTTVLAQAFNYLTFQQYFKLSEDDWTRLLACGWFPFIGLGKDGLRDLLTRVREGWSTEDLVPALSEQLKSRLPLHRNLWRKNETVAPHIDFLEAASRRYEENDHVSTVSILYPRIEGLLRHLRAAAGGTNFRQSELAAAPLETHSAWSSTVSRLLPQRFRQYLESVYFASFSPGVEPSLSRNSVAHGVAPASLYSVKHALIGFLIVEQLCYHLRPNKSPPDTPPSEA
jgi:hypothetical protein